MTLRAADLYAQPIIVGTTDELTEAFALDANVPVGVNYVPPNRQIVKDVTTGLEYVGDGVTAYSDLTPLPGGGSGLTLPTGTGGIHTGMIGIEYDGDPIALVFANVSVIFDTVYTDPDSSDSAALTDPVATDDFTFATSGVTMNDRQFVQCFAEFDFDGPLATPVTVSLNGVGPNASETFYLPIGSLGFTHGWCAALPEGDSIFMSIGGNGDETASLNFAQIRVTKLASVG